MPMQDPKLLAQELHFYIVGLIQEAKISNDLAVLDRMESRSLSNYRRDSCRGCLKLRRIEPGSSGSELARRILSSNRFQIINFKPQSSMDLLT